jgi:hypothetical protein
MGEEELMNARVEPLYAQTGAAFTPALLQSAATTYTDVFGRRERHSSVLLGEHRSRPRVAIELQIGEQTTVLTYAYADAALPAWVTPVLQSISERWGVKPGWDSYDAKPTELRHVLRLLNALSAVMQDDSSAPLVTPLSDGGVQAEWHKHSEALEVVVPADEEARYYYYNEDSAQEEEEAFEPHCARVHELISHF